jgi:hypothetical protein
MVIVVEEEMLASRLSISCSTSASLARGLEGKLIDLKWKAISDLTFLSVLRLKSGGGGGEEWPMVVCVDHFSEAYLYRRGIQAGAFDYWTQRIIPFNFSDAVCHGGRSGRCIAIAKSSLV